MKLLLASLVIGMLGANAATIAVIDSGVDVEHKDLLSKLWTNSIDIANNNRDEDRNGYQDDFYGWNFAENNNLVIDRKYIGTFSKDPYKFFEIQGRAFLGQATQEDKKWLEAKRKDPNFIKEMGKFGNFVHGTHVAGITAEGNDTAKILSVKLIPTEVKLPGQSKLADFSLVKEKGRMKLLKKALVALAATQIAQLEEIAHYVGSHGADIANGSFGTGFKQAKMITDNIFKIFFFRKPNQQESDSTAKFFLNSLVKEGKKMAAAAPNTLFVFAAGNDGSNNDEYPTSPTNIQADNVISVAATYKYNYLAPFSNYGKKMVDIAAPGMLIHSQIPGDEYLRVSGTSQAAPYVAKVAAMIKDANKDLTPKQIKDILTGTVDKKDFLKAKVVSQGIVNLDRALFAAKASLNSDVSSAIKMANSKISDVTTNEKFMEINFPEYITPIAIPSAFKL
ncbi:MAG: S8 family serine peptidase [Bacteriovoracaceae bacterium]|jgi:subtilisin family serine protease|nr:S8 family serine peptidase [Bacteriovoracaceae bacterium]